MKINILPQSIANLLAAGEVVENPSAVVKELVENSIDAGATSVEVAIERGGLDNIRVTDNGCGVDADEVEKVFYPHATSKIESARDLESIGTLGFRGEAMASIAAVSRVEFKTAVANGKGVVLQIEGGKIGAKKAVAANKGTSVTVGNLFFNTPARGKFLRSANAEKNAVTAVIQHVILANPHVAIRYIIDDEIVYDLGRNSLGDAIKALYSDTNAENLVEVDKVHGETSVIGYVGAPGFTKRNRTWQTLFVNNRPVEAGVIGEAVNEVFSNFMTVGNFPFFVLKLTVDLREVDVNIHPRKAQVKFSDNGRVTEFVKRAVNEALDRYLAKKHGGNAGVGGGNSGVFGVESGKSGGQNGDFGERDAEMIARIKSLAVGHKDSVKSPDHILNFFDANESVAPSRVVEQQEMDTASVARYKVLGTVFDTYILVDDGSRLHIIDQHAAHERIVFDKMTKQIDEGKVEKQRLLTPEVLMLSSAEMTKIEGVLEAIGKCGIECEVFGTNCVRILAVPLVVATHGVGALVEGLLGDIRGGKVTDLLRDKIISLCCKSAVKAGTKLGEREIKNLVDAILSGSVVPTCPHGRPVIVSFTISQIEKMFSRK